MSTFRIISLTVTLLLCGLVRTEVPIPLVDAYNKTCGLTRIRGGTIVGGVVAGENEFPWIVSVQLEGNTPKHFCGAVILTERWILSAAHCFQKIVNGGTLERVTVVAGTNDIKDGTGDRYEIEKAIVHKDFVMANFHNDITLLRTKKPISFNKTETHYIVNSVCLPPYNTKKVPYPPNTAVVSGWGTTSSGSQAIPERLLKVTVSLIDHEECKNTYATVHHLMMSDKTLCYGKNQHDSCQGDSGGPLVKSIGGRTTTIGIVSFGAGCGSFPGVYTSVVQYRDWIAANIY